ncbi:hypothetical protein BJV74DRAFT_829184 [Russula compacta]|nr:hypothetical protein BJV74DRAFT_829184 [Russula compacta]
MSNGRKHLVSRIEDVTLGAFGNLQASETLNHLVRYLSTWSGSDKLFMLIQYGAKVLIPILQARARLHHRAGLRNGPTSALAPKLAKLASIIGDARTLWGIWGMLPIVQWLISLERAPPPTRRLLTIERTQGWAMLTFYPLQHLCYLRAHELIPTALPLPFLSSSSSSAKPHPRREVVINKAALSMWSSRLWAAYVVLQLAHLREDRALLLKRQRALTRLSPKEKERVELAGRWHAWYNELAVNMSFLPMTIHWSLEKGIFKNDVWVSLFGLAAAIASFRSGWKATALPPSVEEPPSVLGSEAEATSRISEKQQEREPPADTGDDVR